MASKDVLPWLSDKDPPAAKYPRLLCPNIREQPFEGLDISDLVVNLFNNVPKFTYRLPPPSTISRTSEKTSKAKKLRKQALERSNGKSKSFVKARNGVRTFEESDSDDQSISELAKSVANQNKTDRGQEQSVSGVKIEGELEDSEVIKLVQKFHEKPKRGYREKTFEAMPKSYGFLSHCISCGFSPANRVHPMLKHAGLCSHCEVLLKKVPEVIDPRDGYQANCTLCCREGRDLVMCDSGMDKCLRSFCFLCLNLFLGSAGANKIRSSKKWNCFFCTNSNVGYLHLKRHWKSGFEKFLKNGAKINHRTFSQTSSSCSNAVTNDNNEAQQSNSNSTSSNSLAIKAKIGTKRENNNQIECKNRNEAELNRARTPILAKKLSKREPSSLNTKTRSNEKLLFDNDDEITLADFRPAEQTQKENMQPSPAGSDIANNNCLPASCDQNLMADEDNDCGGLGKVKFSIHDSEEEFSVITPAKASARSRITSPLSTTCTTTSLTDIRLVQEENDEPEQNAHPVFRKTFPHSRSNRFSGYTQASHLKKLCICCTSKNVSNISHPMFIGGVCDDCLPRVCKNIITIMEVPAEDHDLMDLEYLKSMCCICCRNIEELITNIQKSEASKKPILFRCSQSACNYAFCENCLSGLVSTELVELFKGFRSAATSTSTSPPKSTIIPSWTCFMCSDSQYHGILKLQI